MLAYLTDGGRLAAGFKGRTGDCATRALSIVTGRPYREVYDLVNEFCAAERPSKQRRTPSTARDGVHMVTMRKVAEHLGGVWTPTMGIGTGTTVHVRADELPRGRLVLRLSRHFAAFIDGELYDTYDSSRDGTRAVYGYWTFPQGEAYCGICRTEHGEECPAAVDWWFQDKMIPR